MKIVGITRLLPLWAILAGCDSVTTEEKYLRVSLTGGSKVQLVDSGTQRFQIQTNPLVVIDTVTGQVWIARRGSAGKYYLARVCYLSSTGSELMPTPYEDSFTEDLSKFKGVCSQD
jgi:hypothetical protein